MLALFSLDLTIDDDGKPWLIEMNGSRSGFDGFLLAYGDTSIQEAISRAFSYFAPSAPVHIVTRLANFGMLPKGYLHKYVQEHTFLSVLDSSSLYSHMGLAGTQWAHVRSQGNWHTLPSSSVDLLVQQGERFKKVILDVGDPSYVIPDEYFNARTHEGLLTFSPRLTGLVDAQRIHENDIVWLRCSSLAYAEAALHGVSVNHEHPYDAMASNKLVTYNLLSPSLESNLPLSVPIGNRCSSSATVSSWLRRARGNVFIRKPLLGSQGRGIDLVRRADIEDYVRRLGDLEARSKMDGDNHTLPLQLRGVASLLAADALSQDLSLLSELKPSRPVFSSATDEHHFGCMRALALVGDTAEGATEIMFLGAYWRLARTPIAGDGLLWERYIGSQSQGAICEPVGDADMESAAAFANQVLKELLVAAPRQPSSLEDYRRQEERFWLERYASELGLVPGSTTEELFLLELAEAREKAARLRDQAEQSGFLRMPGLLLPDKILEQAGMPYLIRDGYRIRVID